MLELEFDPGELSVTYRGVSVVLLPKEFALLQFLYRHPQQALSREAILDAVWSADSPTDRTVDDHIYRLRKKLQCFAHLFSIDTIRGLGYRFSPQQIGINFDYVDSGINDELAQLFSRYHRLGQGEAMGLLSKHRDVLGFQLAPSSALYLRFINGDYQWIVDNAELPFWPKVFYLLHIYHLCQLDSEKTLAYFYRAVANNHLPQEYLAELRFNSITLYVETARFAQAAEVLTAFRKQVECESDEGLIVFLHVNELLLNVVMGNAEGSEAKLVQTEQLLERYPYLREKGLFLIYKGLWQWRKGSYSLAQTCFEAGLGVLRRSRFSPHYDVALRTIVYHLARFEPTRKDIQTEYWQRWQRLSAEYNFARLEQVIARELNNHL